MLADEVRWVLFATDLAAWLAASLGIGAALTAAWFHVRRRRARRGTRSGSGVRRA